MRIIVVGAGVMGKNHARVLHNLGFLGGIVDSNVEVGKEVADRYGVIFSNHIEDLDFDAAVVATPTITHYKIAKKIISMGKHVLIEKPITLDVEESKELIDSAKEMGVTLTVGHIERFNPIVEFFKKVNKRRSLISIGAKRASGYPSRIRDVGVVMDLGVHDIDVFRYLVGEISTVYANGGNIRNNKYEDHASILLTFRDGKIGYIETNWLTPQKIRKLWLTFTDSYVEGDYIGQWVEISSSKLRYEEYDLYDVEIDLNIRRINLRRDEPLKRELINFVDSIQNNKEPLVTGYDGLMAVKIAKAAIQSMKTGKVVEIE